jgi:DNA polymerase-4
MELPLNHNEPTIMHIDLNSCFATVEQQANPLIRNKPVVVAAYTSANGCVVSPSVEAKRFGIKVGNTVREAKLLCKDVIVLQPDPAKYRDVHIKFKKLFSDYSPTVVPKSIDEAVIDFTGTQGLKRGLVDIGYEIKSRMRKEIGEWLSCNVGISTNRFLAKLAASLHKPDGLDVVTYENLPSVYESIELIDLCGINTRYQARLNVNGIFTPTQFLNASTDLLCDRVFKSIIGYHWYMRLRGWEIDNVDWGRKSYGQSYALGKHTADPQELSRLLMKLTEKMGRRLREAGYVAKGVHVACIYKDYTHWHRGRKVDSDLYTTQELFKKVQWVFNQQPERKVIAKLAVSCFNLQPTHPVQLDLFDDEKTKKRSLSDSLDKINDRYGEYVVTPALMMGMENLILDRIAFGGVKDLEDLYSG